MKYSVLHWVGVCALVALPVGGCSDETTATGGTGGSGGGEGGSGGMPECESTEDCDDGNECTDDTCSAGVCEFEAVPGPTGPDEPGGLPGDGTVCGYYAGTCEGGSCAGTFGCTEAGIREAIAAGAGPHTFDCDGPQTATTQAEIVIDNDVILDGEGFLTVDGNDDHRVFSVAEGVTAELRGFTVTRGSSTHGSGVLNDGTLTLTNSTVSGNTAVALEFPGGGGIYNDGTLTLTNSTVSGNSGTFGGGIFNGGTLTLTNSVVDGDCSSDSTTSNGYNIESPGDTCGFDQATDQVNVTEGQLNLGPLQDNGGPTETHALLFPGSVAIDVIPADMCEVTEDQRGEPRPGGTMCDVGAFEVQP